MVDESLLGPEIHDYLVQHLDTLGRPLNIHKTTKSAVTIY